MAVYIIHLKYLIGRKEGVWGWRGRGEVKGLSAVAAVTGIFSQGLSVGHECSPNWSATASHCLNWISLDLMNKSF